MSTSKKEMQHSECSNLTSDENRLILSKLSKGQCAEAMAIARVYDTTPRGWDANYKEGVVILVKDHKRKSFFVVLHDLNQGNSPLWSHEVYR